MPVILKIGKFKLKKNLNYKHYQNVKDKKWEWRIQSLENDLEWNKTLKSAYHVYRYLKHLCLRMYKY